MSKLGFTPTLPELTDADDVAVNLEKQRLRGEIEKLPTNHPRRSELLQEVDGSNNLRALGQLSQDVDKENKDQKDKDAPEFQRQVSQMLVLPAAAMAAFSGLAPGYDVKSQGAMMLRGGMYLDVLDRPGHGLPDSMGGPGTAIITQTKIIDRDVGAGLPVRALPGAKG